MEVQITKTLRTSLDFILNVRCHDPGEFTFFRTRRLDAGENIIHINGVIAYKIDTYRVKCKLFNYIIN